MALGMFCAFATTVPVQAGVYQIQPDEAASKDTFAYQFLPTTQLETPPFNQILGASKTSIGHDLLSFIQFDLSTLTADGVTAGEVTSAKLKLRSTTNTLGSGDPPVAVNEKPLIVNVSALGADWAENTILWSTAPAVVGGVAASAEVTSVGQLVEFDVTALVKDWLSGSLANFGMQLSQLDETFNAAGNRAAATFVAASGAAADRPMLEVTAVPEPSSLVLLGVAGLLAMRFRKRR
jgi:hypothetical protein